MISEAVQRRARWVLDTIGARDAYRPDAWEAVERGEAPEGDLVADGFFHLARVEERPTGTRPTLLEGGAEVVLHASYAPAEDDARLAREKAVLEALARPVVGQRFHYLRVEPHRNLGTLARLGFAYDSSLGFRGFAVLWHSESFDARAYRGSAELYARIVDGVRPRGEGCLTAAELTAEAARWLP